MSRQKVDMAAMQEIRRVENLSTKEQVHRFWVESTQDFLHQKKTGIDISKKQDHYWKYLDIWEKRVAFNNSTHGTVLDLGAGTGRIAGFLRSNGIEVIATDFVFEALRVIAEDLGVKKCVSMDITKIGLRDLSVDCVVSCRVLQSLPSKSEKAETIAEIARILKPRGKLILTEGNPLRVRFVTVPYNFYISIGEWRNLLEKHGFVIDAVYGIAFLTALKVMDKLTLGISSKFDLPARIAYFLDQIFKATALKHVSLQYDIIATKR